MSAALHPCVGRTSDAIKFAFKHTQPALPAGLGHTTVLACRPEESEALAQRVNGHKAEYERLQKALREANLQAAPAFCSICLLCEAWLLVCKRGVLEECSIPPENCCTL